MNDDLWLCKIILFMFFVVFILCSVGYYDTIPNVWVRFIK